MRKLICIVSVALLMAGCVTTSVSGSAGCCGSCSAKKACDGSAECKAKCAAEKSCCGSCGGAEKKAEKSCCGSCGGTEKKAEKSCCGSAECKAKHSH